ncbi:M23 family metallopeptidase [Streptomyces sp. HNM0574]|uniref:M23 family metallopeptidase n=1 Tax=Streptomyces sp. HNM0574 TaxID=2714954 RepID=UPI00146DBAA2|nr:M23 family metallopeptidase [Streptomyces sp. HNM0574]NLU65742.1 M23 family metallopeptidase [Streptomyces sp. HNM0574]
MAFIRATGKHRRPTRVHRGSANAAGIAGLAAVGVVGSLASPALAATGEKADVHETGLTQAIDMGGSLAQHVSDQAGEQQAAAEQAKAEAAAKKKAAEAKAEAKKRAEEARKKAAEKAKKEREAKERAERAAEAKRAKLNAFVSPIAGSYVSTGYQASSGLWSSGSHTGIDFHAGIGTSVRSVAAGEVVEAGNGGAYGNNVVIKHNDGTYTQYGHLSSIEVSVGQSVTSGQEIALSGNTGNTTGPHLHFEARTGADYGSDIDPVSYLRQHGVNV